MAPSPVIRDAPKKGATVTISVLTVVSAVDGSYSISDVPQGLHAMEVASSGFLRSPLVTLRCTRGWPVAQCRWTLEGPFFHIPPDVEPSFSTGCHGLRPLCSHTVTLSAGRSALLFIWFTLFCAFVRFPDLAASDTAIPGLNDIWALCEEMSQFWLVTLGSRCTAVSGRSVLFVIFAWTFFGCQHDWQFAFEGDTVLECTVVLSMVAIVAFSSCPSGASRSFHIGFERREHFEDWRPRGFLRSFFPLRHVGFFAP